MTLSLLSDLKVRHPATSLENELVRLPKVVACLSDVWDFSAWGQLKIILCVYIGDSCSQMYCHTYDIECELVEIEFVIIEVLTQLPRLSLSAIYQKWH